MLARSSQAGFPPGVKKLLQSDLSPYIQMADLMLPRLLKGFMNELDQRQRSAVEKVIPLGGTRQIFFHLLDTPNPPIVIQLTQPPKLSSLPEFKVVEQKILGIQLTVEQFQLLAGGTNAGSLVKLFWQLRYQISSILSIIKIFMPVLRLGSLGRRDLYWKMIHQIKPLIDFFPPDPS